MIIYIYFVTISLSTTYFAFFPESDEYQTSLFGVWITILIANSFLCGYIAKKVIGPIGLFIRITMIFVILLPACYQLSIGTFYWPSVAKDPYLADTSMMILLMSTVIFEISYLFSVIARPPEFRLHTTMEIKNTKYIALFISILSMVFALYTLYIYGPIALFAPRNISSYYLRNQLGLNLSDIGLTLDFSSGLAAASLVISLSLRYILKIRSFFTYLAMIMSIAANLIANFPIANSRYMMSALVIIVILTTCGRFFRRNVIIFVIALPAIMYSIFPILGSLRNNFILPDRSVLNKSYFEYLLHGDFDGFQSIMNVVYLVEQHGFSLGSRLISTIFFFVPRSIWPDKAQSTGSDAAEIARYGYTNISMPLPGELYSDGGIIAVYLGMTLLGLLIGRLDRWYLRAEYFRVEMIKLIYVICITAYIPILYRGSLLGVISTFAVSIFTLMVFHFLTALLNSDISKGGRVKSQRATYHNYN